MVKQAATRKAFTLIESLFVLIIITMMLYLCIPMFKPTSYISKDSKSLEIYLTQSNAMCHKDKEGDDNITFNEYGHINKGCTVQFGKFTITFQLGNGRFY